MSEVLHGDDAKVFAVNDDLPLRSQSAGTFFQCPLLTHIDVSEISSE